MSQWNYLINALRLILPDYKVQIAQLKKPTVAFNKDFFIRFIHYIHTTLGNTLRNPSTSIADWPVPMIVTETNAILKHFVDVQISVFDILEPGKSSMTPRQVCINIMILVDSQKTEYQAIMLDINNLETEIETSKKAEKQLAEDKNNAIIEKEKTKNVLQNEINHMDELKSKFKSLKLNEVESKIQLKQFDEEFAYLENIESEKQKLLLKLKEETELILQELSLVKQYNDQYRKLIELESQQHIEGDISDTLAQKQADLKKLNTFISELEQHDAHLVKILQNANCNIKQEINEKLNNNLEVHSFKIEDLIKKHSEWEMKLNDLNGANLNCENMVEVLNTNLQSLNEVLVHQLNENQILHEENEMNRTNFRNMVYECKNIDEDIQKVYDEMKLKYQNMLIKFNNRICYMFTELKNMVEKSS